MRISIVGDSLALPRPEVKHIETYAHLLYTDGNEVINCGRARQDTKIAASNEYIKRDILFLEPEVVIIHLGIVDCSPRLFSRTQIRLVKILPEYINKPLINLVSKHRYKITKLRRIVYVKPGDFKNNITKLIKNSLGLDPKMKIVFIKIMEDKKELNKKSFNIDTNIRDYNTIIESVCDEYGIETIDPNICPNGLLNDGIHINKFAHKYIANELTQRILNKSR